MFLKVKLPISCSTWLQNHLQGMVAFLGSFFATHIAEKLVKEQNGFQSSYPIIQFAIIYNGV